MSEYRHIANLTGPQGEPGADATEIPGASYGNSIVLSSSDDLDSLPAGIYRTDFQATSEALGLPGGRNGILERMVPTGRAAGQRVDRFTTNFTGSASTPLEIWVRGAGNRGADNSWNWTDWVQIYPTPSPQDNSVIPPGESVFDLEPGEYRVDFGYNALGNGLPVDSPGYVQVIRSTLGWRTLRFTPTYGDVGSSATLPYEVWVCGMDNDREYYPTWDRVISGGTHIRASQAVVTNGDRNTVFSRFPDRTDRPASTLKIMTAHVARTVITDAMLRETVEFTDADTAPGSSANLQVGDILTWRDLFHGLMLPSGNDAAQCIARIAGGLLSGSGDPYQRFINKMNAVAQDYGWDGASFVNPSGLGSDNQMSPNHLVDLLYRIADDDPWLVEVMGTYRREMTILGTNARTYHVTNSFDPLGEVAFPEAIAAKTGTIGGHTCLALLFEGPNGETCAAAVIGSTSGERYPDMRRLVDAAKRSVDPDAATGGMEIPETNINDRIDGISGGNVTISRSTSGMATLTFAAAGLPDDFEQTGLIPESINPSSRYTYGVVAATPSTSNDLRNAQIWSLDRRIRIYGDAATYVGTITWATK